MLDDDKLDKIINWHDQKYEAWHRNKMEEPRKKVERYKKLNRALVAARKNSPANVAEIQKELRELECSIHINAFHWGTKHPSDYHSNLSRTNTFIKIKTQNTNPFTN